MRERSGIFILQSNVFCVHNTVHWVNSMITFVLAAYRSAGFLASFSANQPRGDLKFDRVHYNEGSWYNPVSGVYTTPYTGYYLITEQVRLHNTVH